MHSIINITAWLLMLLLPGKDYTQLPDKINWFKLINHDNNIIIVGSNKTGLYFFNSKTGLTSHLSENYIIDGITLAKNYRETVYFGPVKHKKTNDYYFLSYDLYSKAVNKIRFIKSNDFFLSFECSQKNSNIYYVVRNLDKVEKKLLLYKNNDSLPLLIIKTERVFSGREIFPIILIDDKIYFSTDDNYLIKVFDFQGNLKFEFTKPDYIRRPLSDYEKKFINSLLLTNSGEIYPRILIKMEMLDNNIVVFLNPRPGSQDFFIDEFTKFGKYVKSTQFKIPNNATYIDAVLMKTNFYLLFKEHGKYFLKDSR